MKLIKVLAIILGLAILGAPMLAVRLGVMPVHASTSSPIYYSVEPTPISPLTNTNSSTLPDGNQHGLETAGGSSEPAAQYFNVTIYLRNATVANVIQETLTPNGANASGVAGVEVHFDFSLMAHATDGSRVCEPIAFQNFLGTPLGVLVQNSTNALSYGINPAFYDKNGNPTTVPGLATQYEVAATSTMGDWNGTQGIVAVIEFEIMGAPSTALLEPDFTAPMTITYSDLTVYIPPTPHNPLPIIESIPFYVINGSLHIDAINTTFDSTTLAVGLYKYVMGLGYGGNITANVENLASVTASFDVEYLANATIIGSAHIATLATMTTLNVSVVGDSNRVGTYSFNNVTVITEPVLGETNLANNNVTLANNNFTTKGAYLIVTIPGDMNGDKQAKLNDLSLLAKAFNKSLGQAGYNPNCDIKNEGKVALADLSLLATHYNTSWS